VEDFKLWHPQGWAVIPNILEELRLWSHLVGKRKSNLVFTPQS